MKEWIKSFHSEEYDCNITYLDLEGIDEEEGKTFLAINVQTIHDNHGDIYKDICDNIIKHNKNIENNIACQPCFDTTPLIIRDNILYGKYIFIPVLMEEGKIVKAIRKFFNKSISAEFYIAQIDIYTLKEKHLYKFDEFANMIGVDPDFLRDKFLNP